MIARALLFLLIFAAAISLVRADESIASVQQVLKDQGFYYGEISGKNDADTTAAIRRYQIRNGLQITGTLTPETQKALGVRSAAAPATATAPPAQTPAPPPPAATPPPQSSERPDDGYAPDGQPRDPPGYAPGPRELQPATSGVFDGTPYEVAPPEVQRRALTGAQITLMRRGYYRSAIDGIYGPGTELAIRSFQAQSGLPPSGRLDMETLTALGLLPGQRTPGIQFRRRVLPRPVIRGQWLPD